MRNEDIHLLITILHTTSSTEPYAKKLPKKITINIDVDVLDYFKDQSSESGIPYQKLMNLYLVGCAKSKKKLEMTWK